MWYAKFITSSGLVISEGFGIDWEAALDIAYTRLMAIPLEARGDCKVKFFFV